jgi:hypothetical protein
MTRSAVFSACGSYRYSLTRSWQSGARNAAIFIMLNPSTADSERDDPTIRRCIGIARSLGCVGVHVVNLFAFRATDPRDMKAARDPVGPDNLVYVQQAIAYRHEHSRLRPGPVICAWGTHGGHLGQDEIVMDALATCSPSCLGVTKHGFPRHPLYVRRDVILQPYRGRSSSRPATVILADHDASQPLRPGAA